MTVNGASTGVDSFTAPATWLRDGTNPELTEAFLFDLGTITTMTSSFWRAIAIDVETTGLDTDADRITQLSALDVTDMVRHLRDQRHFAGRVAGMFELLNPGTPLPPDSGCARGIRDEDLADAPSFDSVAEEIRDYLTRPGTLLIGHDLVFHLRFINAALRRAGLKEIGASVRKQCTLAMSREKLGGAVADYRLETVTKVLGHDMGDAHDSTNDAMAAAFVFGALAGIDEGTAGLRDKQPMPDRVAGPASSNPPAHRNGTTLALPEPAELDSIPEPAEWELKAIELSILLDEFRPRFNGKLAEVVHAARAAGVELSADEVLGTFVKLSMAVSDLGLED